MVLVDSSVWIDYLSLSSSQTEATLESLIRPNNQVVTTGVILQEVLQGIRNERSFRLTEKLLGKLPLVEPYPRTYVRAAEMFRRLASKGKSPTTIDTLLAALVAENRLRLFTLDREFEIFRSHFGLELFK